MDLTGKKVGKLTVMYKTERKTRDGHPYWHCVCECGNEKDVSQKSLANGTTHSCGCLRLEAVHNAKTIHGESGGKLIGPRTRLYRCWINMRSRCYNQNVRSYADYGAKGIEVCEDWHDFKKFSEWAYASGYADDLTIERIDPKGNYCPENCEWITLSENSRRAHKKKCWARNLETDEYIEFCGIADFAEEHGLPYSSIYSVLRGTREDYKNWTFGYLAS